MTSVELVDLTVRRGPNPIVTALSAAIRPGRVFWITGPNGAGKSSLLRVLAGIDRPRAGEVIRADRAGEPFLYFHSEMRLPDWSTVGDWRRLLRALLPQDGDPGPTGLWPEAEDRRRVGRLSTGERKRLLLDALLRRPGSLLLDEPYEHLSPEGKVELTRLLEDRVRRHVVVVATNQVTSRALRDGGLHIEGGAVRRLGPAGTEAEP